MIDLRQIQAFVAVVQEGSFTRAAERIHIGQSGLSAQVKKLEKSIGGRLFDRNGRSVTVTPLGRSLYVHAQDLLAAAERFGSAARVPDRKRMLRLAVAENGVNELALVLLRRIRQKRPDIDLEVHPIPLRDQHRAFDDETDIMIARPPFDRPMHERCTSVTAADDPLVLLVHESLDIAEAASVSTDEVMSTPRLRTTWVPEAWSADHRVFADDGSFAESVAVESFRDAAASVSIRRSACVMPESFARTYNIADVVSIPIADATPMSIDVVYDGTISDELLESLPTLIEEFAAEASEADSAADTAADMADDDTMAQVQR